MSAAHGGEESLAPVIPLFPGAVGEQAGPAMSTVREPGAHDWRTEWDDDPVAVPSRAGSGREAAPGVGSTGDDGGVQRAEAVLLRRLRTRQLSEREARAVLSEHELSGADADALIEVFADRGYLDDARLAEQLVHAGVDRKGQGRQVIARTLAQRGIPREVAEAVLAALPDDDAERALDYARSKARALASHDRDTALRRLVGQLGRRGYAGSVAMAAARQALDEAGSGSGGVRFR